MLWSKQKIFCNACGKEQNKILPGIGKDYKVCSIRCLKEMQYRQMLSMLAKEYHDPPPGYFDDCYDEYDEDRDPSSRIL